MIMKQIFPVVNMNSRMGKKKCIVLFLVIKNDKATFERFFHLKKG